MKIIEELEDNNPFKDILQKAIPALNGLEMEKNTFKFLAHKFQEERNIAISKGLEYKNVLKKTAERYNDFTDLKELSISRSLQRVEIPVLEKSIDKIKIVFNALPLYHR
jgi:hypothetical protein